MGLFGFGKLLVSKYRDPRKTPSPATDWAKQDRETVWSGPPSIVAIDNARGRLAMPRRYTKRKNRVMVRRKAGDSVQGVKPMRERALMFTRMLSRATAGMATAGALAFAAALAPAQAQEAVKIGLILPMTGGQASTGKQIDNAVKLYMQQHGDTVAGKKIEIILKDDAALPDNTKRLAQELIVNDKVSFIAGFGVTPAALAAAPLATQAKIPEVVMAAGTSIITEKSPYIVRTSFTLAQSSTIIADWAAKNGIKKVATLTTDYAPGNDALNFFSRILPPAAGRSSKRSRCPWPIPISRRSCSG